MLNDPGSCDLLGSEYEFNTPSKALIYYTKACELDNASFCRSAGVLLTDGGDGVDKDHDKAVEYYMHSCYLGDDSSCFLAGNLCMEDESIMARIGRAKEMYKTGCSYDNKDCCCLLGEMIMARQGYDFDASKALEFYHKGCELGDWQSCDKVIDVCSEYECEDFQSRAA